MYVLQHPEYAGDFLSSKVFASRFAPPIIAEFNPSLPAFTSSVTSVEGNGAKEKISACSDDDTKHGKKANDNIEDLSKDIRI